MCNYSIRKTKNNEISYINAQVGAKQCTDSSINQINFPRASYLGVCYFSLDFLRCITTARSGHNRIGKLQLFSLSTVRCIFRFFRSASHWMTYEYYSYFQKWDQFHNKAASYLLVRASLVVAGYIKVLLSIKILIKNK